MRIYLAAAMTNAARDLASIRTLLECLEGYGHDVPTRQVASPLGREAEAQIGDAELARRDLDWVAGCDALIAEVSTPSHGVGIEVAVALAGGKPVLLVHRCEAPVSRLLLGLAGVEVLAFAGRDDLTRGVLKFLGRVGERAAAPVERG